MSRHHTRSESGCHMATQVARQKKWQPGSLRVNLWGSYPLCGRSRLPGCQYLYLATCWPSGSLHLGRNK